MSTALAIAGVTAVLRDLLNDGLINHNVSGVLGSTRHGERAAAGPVVPASGTEASQLNLFLHQVTPNPGWRNEGLPSRDALGPHAPEQSAARARPALPALAYSGGDLHAEILLGYAMQLLHEMPVLTREAIRTALQSVARRRHARCRRRCARSPTRASRTRSSRSSITPST